MFNFQRTINFDTTNTVLVNFSEHLLSVDDTQLEKILNKMHEAIEHDKIVIIDCKGYNQLEPKLKNDSHIQKIIRQIVMNLMTPQLNDSFNKHIELHFVNTDKHLERLMDFMHPTDTKSTTETNIDELPTEEPAE